MPRQRLDFQLRCVECAADEAGMQLNTHGVPVGHLFIARRALAATRQPPAPSLPKRGLLLHEMPAVVACLLVHHTGTSFHTPDGSTQEFAILKS
jgi:hypothetical protein